MSMHAATTTPPPSDSSSAAWQLIRNDVFGSPLDDDAIERLVAERARTSATPYADTIGLMVGMSLDEVEAARLYAGILAHRRQLSVALGRSVHVRVAALDLLTLRGARRSPRESRPIMVAPAFLERALEEASLDAVTGLPRGAHFTSLLDHELLQRGQRVAVAFLDLDGFKRVNDEHGHARGDEVLRTLATAARSVLRRGDVVARLGGDEFSILLPETDEGGAKVVFERFRELLASSMKERGWPITASVGAMVYPSPPATLADALRDADGLMYRAKENGKNRVHVEVASKR